MNQYLFFLGQNHPLSLAELDSRFPKGSLNSSAADLAYLNIKEDPTKIACELGGTTKIAIRLEELSEDIEAQLLRHLLKQKATTFTISFLQTNPNSISIHHSLKKQLPGSIRYVLPKGSNLSPLIFTRQHVTELIVDQKTNSLFQTLWVHDFNAWIARDRDKPYITPSLGMLPPKLARIMVNLALKNQNTNDTTLLDPFCGSGTILSEALLLGVNVIGSDFSKTQVEGASKNLTWLPQEFFCSPRQNSTLLVSDATHISDKISSPVDAVVTEPYLGPLTPKKEKQLNIAKGLFKLYKGALKDWQKILKPKHTIVMAYPLFELQSTQKYFHAFIDTCTALGYNLRQQNLIFTRPNAKIQRQIIILDK